MFIHLKFITSLVEQGPITFTFGFIFFKFYHTLYYSVELLNYFPVSMYFLFLCTFPFLRVLLYCSIFLRFICLQLFTRIHDFLDTD